MSFTVGPATAPVHEESWAIAVELLAPCRTAAISKGKRTSVRIRLVISMSKPFFACEKTFPKNDQRATPGVNPPTYNKATLESVWLSSNEMPADPDLAAVPRRLRHPVARRSPAPSP